jgi:hypothetical protein
LQGTARGYAYNAPLAGLCIHFTNYVTPVSTPVLGTLSLRPSLHPSMRLHGRPSLPHARSDKPPPKDAAQTPAEAAQPCEDHFFFVSVDAALEPPSHAFPLCNPPFVSSTSRALAHPTAPHQAAAASRRSAFDSSFARATAGMSGQISARSPANNAGTMFLNAPHWQHSIPSAGEHQIGITRPDLRSSFLFFFFIASVVCEARKCHHAQTAILRYQASRPKLRPRSHSRSGRDGS